VLNRFSITNPPPPCPGSCLPFQEDHVIHEHAGKTIQRLDLEVKDLLAKAEQADSTPLEDGLAIPQEVQRRLLSRVTMRRRR
jgi:hypothetical protein